MLFGPFARHGLSHRAQSEFGRRKCRKSLAAANAGGGSGKEDRAVPAWNHHASGFAADQESGVARQFPSLEEQLFGRLQQRLFDVRARIEEADLDRADGFLDIGEQILNLSLLAGIDAEGMDLAAFCSEFLD